MNEVARQEKKFLLSLGEYYKYRDYISKLILPDPHNDTSGYRVRSLYFDSFNDRDYFEKLEGIELRRKIRLRIYHPDDAFVSLELKQKQGMYQKKKVLKITRALANCMTKGDYSLLPEQEDPFATECYGIMSMHSYRPKSLIEYEREAFIIPGSTTRITFDKNILVTEGCFDFFSKKPRMYPVYNPSYVILEVKYTNYLLSYVKDIITACNKSEISVSKYMLGRGLNIGLY